ncbi:S1 family peptidase [Streptomyces sp. Z26]|uniref:S1 family peptidase n=1 Tax=Streptomyces sp. Z26 TaxID=2500177 RepID=UPI0023E7C3B5|nr:S1 family peptidase [Streptomyces sp. Z26]
MRRGPRPATRTARPARAPRARTRTLIRTLAACAAALLAALVLPAAPAAAVGTADVTAVRGGDVLYGSGGTVCAVGFNARDASASYGLLPGHCAAAAQTWFADPALTVQVGVTAGAQFPGSDYGVIRYTNPDLSYPGEIRAGGQIIDITGAAAPTVGRAVCRAGTTTGVRCGTVTAVNVTINHPEGAVTGLFATTVCAEPGERGGSAYSGTTALGLEAGGSGNCASGGASYYQPVTEVLAAYGLTLY